MIPHDRDPQPSQPVVGVPTIITVPSVVAVKRRGRGRQSVSLHPLMDACINALAPLGRSYLRGRGGMLGMLVTWCAEQHLDPVVLTGEDLGRFRSWVLAQPIAYHTARHTLGFIRLWFRWLVAAGHRPDDPAAKALNLRTLRPGVHLPTARYIHTPLHPHMTAYIEHHRLRGREGTADVVNLILRQFAAWCHDQRIEPMVLTRTQADAYLIWLTTQARTPSGALLARTSVSQRITYVSGWYAWMEAEGMIVANPARALRVRVVHSRVVLHQHLTLQEAIALVQTQAQAVLAAEPGSISRAWQLRLLSAVCLALATGRRISGITGMRVTDLDLDRCELRVAHEKGAAGRVLPVAGWAIAVVRDYLREARPLLVAAATTEPPWLLVGNNERNASRMRSATLGASLRLLLRATVAANPDLTELAGKTITWHSLRVSFATLLFGNGCPIRSVNELMLHRSLATTARYTPIPVEDMQQIWRTAHPRP